MNHRKLDQLIETGYDFDIREAFENGWNMFRTYPAYSAGFTFFVIFLQLFFLVYLSDYALLFGVFLAAPLTAGYFLAANKITQGNLLIYPDFFKGFQYYVPLIVVNLLGQILVAVGLIALVIPGIYLLVCYLFSSLMVLFGGFEFWQALENSRKLIQVKWFKFFVFGLFAVLLNILGALFFLVGLAITMPVTYFAIYYIFEQVTREVFVEGVEESQVG
ncbi:hypothetical protein ADIS_4556 [Lunatimonas lonarensis]|uniref:Uncharacterized protein n=1 Tax=Lunatimonas lonarensis TaxID=1232681 RepID=R7ZLW2_9BACT|nr:hypothetical protein [Lunatimonas lonarensis]EON75067.1 hypothetical protein ADIS_4556 [Lunatimonas lonarensis]